MIDEKIKHASKDLQDTFQESQLPYVKNVLRSLEAKKSEELEIIRKEEATRQKKQALDRNYTALTEALIDLGITPEFIQNYIQVNGRPLDTLSDERQNSFLEGVIKAYELFNGESFDYQLLKEMYQDILLQLDNSGIPFEFAQQYVIQNHFSNKPVGDVLNQLMEEKGQIAFLEEIVSAYTSHLKYQTLATRLVAQGLSLEEVKRQSLEIGRRKFSKLHNLYLSQLSEKATDKLGVVNESTLFFNVLIINSVIVGPLISGFYLSMTNMPESVAFGSVIGLFYSVFETSIRFLISDYFGSNINKTPSSLLGYIPSKLIVAYYNKKEKRKSFKKLRKRRLLKRKSQRLFQELLLEIAPEIKQLQQSYQTEQNKLE